MKARVKATGEIVDGNAMVSFNGDDFYLNELEAIIDETEKIYDELDEVYWKNLEHQYAGMAMQGILSNYELYHKISKSRNLESAIMEYASDLVKRLKEKEERK